MKKRELHFAATERVLHLAEEILFPAGALDGRREHGFIGLVTASSGTCRRTLILHSVVVPGPGDVSWDLGRGLLFSPSYKSRAADAATAVGAGLVFAHTHPFATTFPTPSPDDLEADARDLYFLGKTLPTGGPLVGAVVGGGKHWSAREYAFGKAGREEPRFEFASTMRVVGPSLRKIPLGPTADQSDLIDAEAHDSSIRLWGTLGQAKLTTLRVGLPGLGGVGSILAEHVPRLGVGGMVLVDFDRLSKENANRQQGATPDDIRKRRLKLDVAARLAARSATAPGFQLTAVEGSVVEATTVPDLLDCDIILNAADSPWARQVLDQLAFAHLIPVINGGTDVRGNPETHRFVAGKCEVAVAAPGHPCFECAEVYNISAASMAREHPDVRGERGYLRAGERPLSERSPSVISTNAVVAGLMQLRLQAIALGTTPEAVVGTQRFHLLDGVADYAVVGACTAECGRSETTGLGDLHPLPLGIDRDYEVARAGFPKPRSRRRRS